MRTKIVPVITGALRTNKDGLNWNLQLLPDHPSVKELQITLMSSANIMRKVLGYLTLISF
jgi:hypothetical protein